LKVRGFWNDGIRKRNPHPPLSLEKGEAETMSVGRPLPLHSVERFGINAQQPMLQHAVLAEKTSSAY
jgi:hypothetical protein